jgi:A/G-specific adenine glycosylase
VAIHPSTIRRFAPIVRVLMSWLSENRRPLIWRGKRPSPYVVLVSEFMLQQTAAQQVDKKLPGFLEQFPTVHALAAATRPEILRAWHGLGYNRRALNLHAAAQSLVQDYSGTFPKDYSALRALPGVGDYTANAILSFAFRLDVPVVDVNIERVLSRLWKPMKTQDEKLPMRDVRELDLAVLPKGESHRWHEALMDFGATICTKRNPKCAGCPLRPLCPSAKYLIKSETAKRRSTEPQYFGAPRRIWRGRTLKAISTLEPVSIRSLVRQFDIDDTGFADFIADIVSRLEAEGFITKKRGVICLAE